MPSVLRTEVVGLEYYTGAVLIEDCKLGDKVYLKPNPDNEIDVNAIEVHLPSGDLLGHIGREDAKYFTSIWDEIEKQAVIIALEGGLDSECYGLKLAVHAKANDLGHRKGVLTFSYQLKPENERAYIFVDCSLSELKKLKQNLLRKGFYTRKDGECRWRTNDGHKYRWFISVSKSDVEFVMPASNEIEDFFLDEYQLLTRLHEIRELSEKLASVEADVANYEEEIESEKARLQEISTQMQELKTKKRELEDFTSLQQEEYDDLESKYQKLDAENQGRQNKIELLKNEKSKLAYDLSELGAPAGGISSYDSPVGEIFRKIFPHFEFLRDSLDKLIATDSKDLYAIIGKCEKELSTTGKTGWKNYSVKGWREHYYHIGHQDTGRLYARFNEAQGTISLLVSDKASQTGRDKKFLDNN